MSISMLYAGKDWGKLKYINTLGGKIHAGYMQKTIYGKKDRVFGTLCNMAIPTVNKLFSGVDPDRMKVELKDRLCLDCNKQLKDGEYSK